MLLDKGWFQLLPKSSETNVEMKECSPVSTFFPVYFWHVFSNPLS